MTHKAALAPFLFLIAIGVFVMFVMAISSGCVSAAKPSARHHAKADDLGQALIESQNYKTPRQHK